MSAVLSLTIPFFALIFLGMICRRVGFVGPDAVSYTHLTLPTIE